MEVYFDGGWKENGDKMIRLHDPTGQSMDNSEFDSFADQESKSNCYYIDFSTSMAESAEPTVAPAAAAPMFPESMASLYNK